MAHIRFGNLKGCIHIFHPLMQSVDTQRKQISVILKILINPTEQNKIACLARLMYYIAIANINIMLE